ncbi:uncharacterized protein TRIADDRAFT_61581 [Trichoplax adhaerens]|uniref:Uncharacterized protein n=1 Tax=Trichoplax adhaerens TaxID=10228 RepID=B3SBE0_TRIAD|nr:predicted protein [Trichoplax adhaerens]EDV19992.1 predicted protein [Trichoplax adhaerens]|eukprot:XP_002117582.1 predicted protein [Trichoplax adhaerens]
MIRKDLAWYQQLCKQFIDNNNDYLYDPKNKITYYALQKSDISEASQVGSQCMARNPFYLAIGMSAEEYLKDIVVTCQIAADAGISSVARDSHGNMVGINLVYSLFTAINVTYGQESFERCGQKFTPFLNALVQLLKTTPWHEYGDPQRIAYIDDLAVLKSASGIGIGFILPEISVALAQRQGYTHITGITTEKILEGDANVLPNWKVINSIDVASIAGNDGKEKAFESIARQGHLRLQWKLFIT